MRKKHKYTRMLTRHRNEAHRGFFLSVTPSGLSLAITLPPHGPRPAHCILTLMAGTRTSVDGEPQVCLRLRDCAEDKGLFVGLTQDGSASNGVVAVWGAVLGSRDYCFSVEVVEGGGDGGGGDGDGDGDSDDIDMARSDDDAETGGMCMRV